MERITFSSFESFASANDHGKMTHAPRLSLVTSRYKNATDCNRRLTFFCKQSMPLLSKFYRIVSLCFSGSKSRKDLNLKTKQTKAQVLFNLSICFQSSRTRLLHCFDRIRWCSILHELFLNACGFSLAQKCSLRIFVIPNLLNVPSPVINILAGKLEMRWIFQLICL